MVQHRIRLHSICYPLTTGPAFVVCCVAVRCIGSLSYNRKTVLFASSTLANFSAVNSECSGDRESAAYRTHCQQHSEDSGDTSESAHRSFDASTRNSDWSLTVVERELEVVNRFNVPIRVDAASVNDSNFQVTLIDPSHVAQVRRFCCCSRHLLAGWIDQLIMIV